MEEFWHHCISDELDAVETVMEDAIRSENSNLTEMCQYVLNTGGKRLRPAMCILSCYACGNDSVKGAIKVGSAIELIHNATLIHDDINDRGEVRRGAKALYKEYALGKSIVSGDYLLAIGFHMISNVSLNIVNFVVNAAMEMGTGEFDQKKFEHKDMVTEDDYMKIISGKTAMLFDCAAKSGAYLADKWNMDAIDAMGEFAFESGKAFQIVDDVLDVIGDENNTGKSVGNDIMEGKPTLPTIYAMNDPEYGPRIKEIFDSNECTREMADEAISLIKETNAVDRCLAKSKTMVLKAIEGIDFLPDSIYKDALINMAKFFAIRDR